MFVRGHENKCVFREESEVFGGRNGIIKTTARKQNSDCESVCARFNERTTKFVNRHSMPRGFVYLGEQFLIFCYNEWAP